MQDALQRRDDRGSQTEKQQDGHNALRRPDITGHQCSSPTSYIYYAESVMEPVNALHEFLAPVSMHLDVHAS